MTDSPAVSAPRVHEILDRVHWSDCDPMGIIYYGAYIRLFQVAEEELMRACGLPFAELRLNRGVWIPRKAMHMEFHSPAQLDEAVAVTAHFAKIGVSSLTFQFEVYRASDRTHRASGTLTVVNVDKDSMTKRPLPDEVRRMLSPYAR